MGVADFIDAIATDNKVEAKAAFETEIKSRVADAIEAKRVEVGSAMSTYGTQEQETGNESDEV
jgi:hypothetical protein